MPHTRAATVRTALTHHAAVYAFTHRTPHIHAATTPHLPTHAAHTHLVHTPFPHTTTHCPTATHTLPFTRHHSPCHCTHTTTHTCHLLHAPLPTTYMPLADTHTYTHTTSTHRILCCHTTPCLLPLPFCTTTTCPTPIYTWSHHIHTHTTHIFPHCTHRFPCPHTHTHGCPYCCTRTHAQTTDCPYHHACQRRRTATIATASATTWTLTLRVLRAAPSLPHTGRHPAHLLTCLRHARAQLFPAHLGPLPPPDLLRNTAGPAIHAADVTTYTRAYGWHTNAARARAHTARPRTACTYLPPRLPLFTTLPLPAPATLPTALRLPHHRHPHRYPARPCRACLPTCTHTPPLDAPLPRIYLRYLPAAPHGLPRTPHRCCLPAWTYGLLPRSTLPGTTRTRRTCHSPAASHGALPLPPHLPFR